MPGSHYDVLTDDFRVGDEPFILNNVGLPLDTTMGPDARFNQIFATDNTQNRAIKTIAENSLKIGAAVSELTIEETEQDHKIQLNSDGIAHNQTQINEGVKLVSEEQGHIQSLSQKVETLTTQLTGLEAKVQELEKAPHDILTKLNELQAIMNHALQVLKSTDDAKDF